MSLMRTVFVVSLAFVANQLDAQQSLESEFDEVVRPFVQSYCLDCHDDRSREGDLDLSGDADLAAIVGNFRRWSIVGERIESGDMPPDDADSHPTPQQRKAIIEFIERVKRAEIARSAGDPGVVLARRLNQSELDYTIADLTGARIDPAKSFPVDPANEAGFDNSGDSLTMSPVLLKKYLEAARVVSNHMALTPSGIEFSPHPVMTDTDRDKFCVNRIIDFYKQQRTDYADYFYLIWRFQNRDASDSAEATLADMARGDGLSPRYAITLAELLDDESESVGPIAVLREIWNKLPDAATGQDLNEAKSVCRQMADFIERLREALIPEVPNLTAPEMNPGSQPLVLSKNHQLAANRRRYAGGGVADIDIDLNDSISASLMKANGAEQQNALERSLAKFCNVFPDTFFVSERARTYLDSEDEKKQGRSGRFLSAGFHSQMGYFRDDRPLYDLMLDPSQQAELDRLWLELDFVSSAPMRQYSGFIWFDRTDSGFMRDREFDRYRAEDKDNNSESKLRGLEELYSAKAKRLEASEEAISAIHQYFDDLSKTFRRLEELHIASEPRQLNAVIEFAGRAYRRPLESQERTELAEFYQLLRGEYELDHEDAIRDVLIRVLMSPHFCYRVDVSSVKNATGKSSIEPLDDYALANRLSYFLWSSMPDKKLMELAAIGQLHRPEVLIEQTHRMLGDARVQRFATQFAGSWLDFRFFQQHNGVDRNRFPEFTDELRQAMYEEPIRFLQDLIEREGSVLDCLYANHTFVNAVLAKQYGVPESNMPTDSATWIRWDDAGASQRGGLLPMAVFLANNSPGLRTSPVKRGNWIVKRIFGEHIPAPPATVPELPEDESKLGDLTLRETLAMHREHASCAACHERIDSFGLAFESYDPVGHWRDQDLGGRDVDDSVVFPNGMDGQGIQGLRQYIREERQDDFLDNLCRKLLAYGLSRNLQLSDESIIEQMRKRLENNQYRFASMVEVIVTNPAFLNKRVRIETELATRTDE